MDFFLIIFGEWDIYFSNAFSYLSGVHRISCLVILLSYKEFLEDFLVGSSGSKHSPSVFPYQPPNLLRKNATWFLLLLHCYMTSTSAKGYQDHRMLKFIHLKKNLSLFVIDNMIFLLYSVVKMPCTSEHEGGEIRDKIWIYKYSVRNQFHLLLDSSISHEMSLQVSTLMVFIVLCQPVICLGQGLFWQSETRGQNQISQWLIPNNTIYYQVPP